MIQVHFHKENGSEGDFDNLEEHENRKGDFDTPGRKWKREGDV